MHVKPGDLLFWDEDWEFTHSDLDDVVESLDLDEGAVITVYRAKVIEPIKIRVVDGEAVEIKE